jgi:hypothetical protein
MCPRRRQPPHAQRAPDWRRDADRSGFGISCGDGRRRAENNRADMVGPVVLVCAACRSLRARCPRSRWSSSRRP